jgi:ribosomal-protein-alanine N-acetyltransferase
MQLQTLETPRLLLKKLSPEDFVSLFENYPDTEAKKILGLNSDEELIKEKEKSKGGYVTYDRSILAFLLVLKETGETIGRCGFHNWYSQHRRAEIGYLLNAEENKRKGYMSEALKIILDHGFGNMNLNRIEACTSPANIASQNLLKKYGFVQEGYLRQHFVRTDVAEDSLVFSLLKQEYNPL